MSKDRSFVSIVISAYNEEENIAQLHSKLKQALSTIPDLICELIFVNDGSTDSTFDILKSLQYKNDNVKIVNLVRNFGHEIAMTAGMDHALGNAVLFMDADLQHPPELIPEIIKIWRSGYDMVLTNRVINQDETFMQKLSGRLFYGILNFLSEIHIPSNAPDFRLIDRKYVEVIRQMKENNRMFRGLISWIGCPNQTVIDFNAPKRYAGKSKYSFKKLLALAINSIVSFSIKPLRIATYIGLVSALFSILMGGFFVWQFLSSDTYEYTGYGTTLVMIIFLGSVQLIVLGIIGEYLGRIHLEIKNRPLYVAEYITQ